ncbi:hypothetical protein TorRG33x02_056470, partial [Trema orientale]
TFDFIFRLILATCWVFVCSFLCSFNNNRFFFFWWLGTGRFLCLFSLLFHYQCWLSCFAYSNSNLIHQKNGELEEQQNAIPPFSRQIGGGLLLLRYTTISFSAKTKNQNQNREMKDLN